ncbi:hypothetical protein GCM10025783_04920 [Amnibacterium soli]|uniref:Uncharacterized protein n=1 Tax=Amnibacterium soli TaxID=1282736 RepID=A0ABP8YUS7_9MICO
MAEPRTSSAVISGSPVPVDAVCCRCRREGVFTIALFVLTMDGPRQVGERVFCVCETKPTAPKATITNGDAKRTGGTCDKCNRVSMYEVPFYAMTPAGISPHSTRVICRECDTRPRR